MKTELKKWMRLAWKPLLAALGLLVLIIWTTGVLTDRVEPGVVPALPGRPLPADADTLLIEAVTEPQRVDVIGSLTSEHHVLLTARLNAHVREIHADAGDRVTEGQVLLRLDDRSLRADRTAAEAALRQAETEYNRLRNLFERQATTEQQLIAAESAYESAQAALTQIDVQLSYTEIEAPMTGTVAERHVEPGTLVAPGQLLFTVYDETRMRIDAAVPVRFIDFIQLNDPVEVRLERPDTILTGVVQRIVAAIDPQTRTQTVQVRLDTDGHRLLPGSFGRVGLHAGERTTYRVPESALIMIGQLNLLDVVVDDRVVRRKVTIGDLRDGETEILSGITAGEVILNRSR